ncbi:MAG TPA: D-alanyl-D-alanine carboxypeptidase/D-alanyl-D-alanine-endopeptidase [Thiobacillaceae bacterium]|nr:D-alanyl-D-alanine carboxypeptidase/D-alanyl-D-alanine-endopeptidase [Thiobacillaceae bacterium]
MPFQTAFRLAVALLFAGGVASAGAAALPPAFTGALKYAGIPLDHVAVVVQPLGAAQPTLAHNADAALNPASVMKLVTSFAALDRLGPNYTWTTDVWADGTIADGVLDGNLVIKGHGDPGMTLERIWLLQRELRARGIRHVRGNLVLDLSHFDLPPYDPAAFDGDPLALYNAGPGPLVANFNATTLWLRPEGGAVRIEPDVALPGVGLRSQVVLEERSTCGAWKDALVPAQPDPTRAELVVYGRYARGCGEQSWSLNLFEPATNFALTFRGLWAETGGSIDGATVPGMAPYTEPLLRFRSEPLAATLVRLNKHSNNLMTRNLFLTLGAETYGAPATLEKGARAVREALERHGVPTLKLVLENGSGLSRIERVSAATLARLLSAAWQSPLFAEFESALPIVAVDGTLKRRFNGSPLGGRAHLKTGTLRDASALAGYVMTARGERVSFVMLVNHASAGRSEAAQRVLLEWIHAGGIAGAGEGS